MTKGISLLSFGHTSYGKWAFNLALSLKKFNPDIKIQLIHDEASLSHLQEYHRGFFDIFTPIKEDDQYITVAGIRKIYPAQIKTRIYDYIEFDNSVYMDVDAVAMRDCMPLINDCIKEGGYYYTQIHSVYTPMQGGDVIPDMAWASAKTIWEHYRLAPDAALPATQSSFAFIKKCKESENLFKRLRENLDNTIPVEKLRLKWGGSIPDELILNVTLAQMNIAPQLVYNPVYFSNKFNGSFEYINSHYLLGIFGMKGVTNSSLVDYYDRLMHNYCREHYGIGHFFKAHELLKHKFSAKRVW